MSSKTRQPSKEQPDVSSPSQDYIAPAPRVSVQAFCETAATSAAVESAGLDRRLGKAHLTIKMGGMPAAIDTYHTQPTPNVIVIETRDNDDILAVLDELAPIRDAGSRA